MYIPGSTEEKTYCPTLFVTPGMRKPTGSHTSETDALPTTLPCGSVTRPVTVAVPGVCGQAARASKTNDTEITAARIHAILVQFPPLAARSCG